MCDGKNHLIVFAPDRFPEHFLEHISRTNSQRDIQVGNDKVWIPQGAPRRLWSFAEALLRGGNRIQCCGDPTRLSDNAAFLNKVIHDSRQTTIVHVKFDYDRLEAAIVNHAVV